MRFFTKIAILFYVATIVTMGLLVVYFVLSLDPELIREIDNGLITLHSDMQIRILVGLTGFLFILLSFLFARLISGKEVKERTIAFDNPAGRVSISLVAIEDMIKRVGLREPEIKEIRPDVIATKKGLQIDTRLVLRSDTNIPDLTSRLQELVKGKIQEMIGIDETVVVRVHVIKIISEEGRKRKTEYNDKPETTLPFQGYRA